MRKEGLSLSSPVLVILILIFLSLARPVCSGAQAPTSWSDELTLIEPDAGWADLAVSLTSDQADGAHIAWLRRSDDHKAYLIYYSYWNESGWTEPNDIFAGGPDDIGWPVLVADDTGRLHAFWSTGTFIYHSWAQIGTASRTDSWISPEVVATCDQGCSVPMDVARDQLGVFHLVYAEREGSVLYSTFSPDIADNAQSETRRVSEMGQGETAYMPSLTIAETGTIHVAWTESNPSDGTTTRVSYSRSTTGGLTWSDKREFGGRFHADTNVGSYHGLLYIAWNGGVGAGGRYLQQSSDDGLTWSPVIQISSMDGRAGYPSIVFDSAGILHLLTGQGEYSAVTDGRPTPPLPIFTVVDHRSIEQSRLAVVGGNQLLAVSPLQFSGIHYATRQLDAPHSVTPFSVRPIQEAPHPANPASSVAVNAKPGTNAAAPLLTNVARQDTPSDSYAHPIFLSTAAATAVVGVAVITKIASRRKH